MIYSPPCHPRCSCLSFFSRKEMKVFEENIPGFFSILWTSLGFNGLKVQIAVSVQLQRALHDPRRGIRVLSRETIGHFLKKNILFNHKCSSCTALRCAMHYIITLEKLHLIFSSNFKIVQHCCFCKARLT